MKNKQGEEIIDDVESGKKLLDVKGWQLVGKFQLIKNSFLCKFNILSRAKMFPSSRS
jgi:hypothetical protein